MDTPERLSALIVETKSGRQAVLGRVGSAEDIANATVMLCRADTVTGQTLVVDGGILLPQAGTDAALAKLSELLQ